MNFNTFSPTAKVLKKIQNHSNGHPTSSEVPCIAVINASDALEAKALVNNVVAGIKFDAGVSVYVHNVPSFGYANKINPMTAKYADSFRRIAMQNALAIIKSNMIDGVVIVADCDTTACGLLEGCLLANCPAMVMPLGTSDLPIVEKIGKPVVQLAGAVTGGQITKLDSDEILKHATMPNAQYGFFHLLENLGLCVQGAGTNKRLSGQQLAAGIQTGKAVTELTRDLKSPKKIFTKDAWTNVVDFCLTNQCGLGSLYLLSTLFNANDIKLTHESTGERIAKLGITHSVKLSGTAVGGVAYAQFKGEKPSAPFTGKSWVYRDLEDADRALLGGNIPSGSVVVLQNCVGVNVSAFAHAIQGMGKATEIAIATDGVCEITDVLTVILASPNSLANEEFANIQNGDTLEIDITKGRFNTNVLSKELKTRQKRSTVKKPTSYF